MNGNPAAKRDYDAALEQYARASGSFDRARTPEQLEPVAAALEEGRYLMASAEARLEGAAPPERRPACFFDPRHGPSVRDVDWSPDGGAPRAVPACAACALRVEEGVGARVAAGARRAAGWCRTGRPGRCTAATSAASSPGLMLGELIGGLRRLRLGRGDDRRPRRRRLGRRRRRGRLGGGGGDFGGGGGDFGGGGGGGDF